MGGVLPPLPLYTFMKSRLRHVGTSLSWRDEMLQLAGTSAPFGAETGFVTYRSHCSVPAAVR
jgi:hypothetical protein